jgi:transposase-like protein
MPVQRKQYSADFKAKVALEAIRGTKTANEIASEYGVHPTQIAEWKKLALERIPELFNTRGNEKHRDEEALIATLYQQIGQLKVELDWVKKKSR